MITAKSPNNSLLNKTMKHKSGKTSLQQPRASKRRSAGDIYSDKLLLISPKQTPKGGKKQLRAFKETPTIDWQGRKKSYAELVVDEPRCSIIASESREERETLSKAKFRETCYLQQPETPKSPPVTRAKNKSMTLKSFELSQSPSKGEQTNFIQHLGSYLTQLQSQEPPSKTNNLFEQFNETIKVSKNSSDTTLLASKLQQSQIKIKELKIKNRHQENEISTLGAKEGKMREVLYQMMDELKKISGQLKEEKVERRKLQRIFERMFEGGPSKKQVVGREKRLERLEKVINGFESGTEEEECAFQRQRGNRGGSVGKRWRERSAASFIRNRLPSRCSESQFDE